MEIKNAQDKIKEFDKARGWGDNWNIKKTRSLPHTKVCGLFSGFLDDPKSKTLKLRPHSKECGFRFMDMKDLLLNITEEGGEMWSLVKWINDEKQKKVVAEHKPEVSDYIGDTLFLLLKIANQADVDAAKALQDTLEEYEKRMPPDIMKKAGHANKLAGGVDNK